ncbi:MAG: hypothetical protein C4519_28560 [Desulfobacteraceae bacterium]|nr:MAG: hypothetical protein C4519_28560 [Desulfobacteraceae bacterium]
MNTMSLPRSVVYLWIGLISALALMVLTGAGGEAPIGRYQMEIVSRNNFADIFVMDTTTGVVKYVGKDEGKPFEQIQGK